MKKMDGKSLDLTEQNIEKLKALFPQVVTENQIDFEKLRLILGDEVDTGPEKYQFTWPGKADSIRLAQEPSTKTLRPVMEDSKDWDTTKNLYIEGDNLEVLKQLQKTYHGKVDMIYIDPPYNTGNDFVYNDKFAQSTEDYKIETNQGLISNPETSGRYHSNWLNMMYPRLFIAKNILSEEGVIFISIDEHEVTRLKLIMDEIFGESNFIAKFIWEKTHHFGRQSMNCYENAEYILVYSKKLYKNDGSMHRKLVENIKTDLEDAPLYNASNSESTLKFPPQSVKFNIKDGQYDRSKDEKFQLIDPVLVKDGYNVNEFRLKFKSRWSQKRVDEEIKKGTIFWVKTENFSIRSIYHEDKRTLVSPRQIIFTNNNNPARTIAHERYLPDTTEHATRELNKLMGLKVFDYPKPSSLVMYLLSLFFLSKDGIVLDFFSGSSTTAHAVTKLNAEDGGNRQFIMVQLPEETEKKSEAYKAGYENICEIAKERIRRAGEQIKEELKEKQSKGEDVRDPDTLDVGFKVFRLDETNIVPWEGKKVEDEEAQIDLLTMLEEVFKEDRSSLDIAYEIMLKYGVFDQDLEKVSINDKEMFDVGHGYMLICLEENIGAEDINVIGEKGYTHVVFNDRSFKDDNVKLNAEHSLKNMGVEEVVSI